MRASFLFGFLLAILAMVGTFPVVTSSIFSGLRFKRTTPDNPALPTSSSFDTFFNFFSGHHGPSSLREKHDVVGGVDGTLGSVDGDNKDNNKIKEAKADPAAIRRMVIKDPPAAVIEKVRVSICSAGVLYVGFVLQVMALCLDGCWSLSARGGLLF
jgi:hypothetical protein